MPAPTPATPASAPATTRMPWTAWLAPTAAPTAPTTPPYGGWRDAFQNDFAARIQWSRAADFTVANHHPVVSINGDRGTAPVYVEAEAGSTLEFDARATHDPDAGDRLTFKWWHYREPSASQWNVESEVAALAIEPLDADGRIVRVRLPGPEQCCVELISRKALPRGQLLHLILEVTDSGAPPLTSYRRIIIQATNKDLRGGGGGAEAVGDLARETV